MMPSSLSLKGNTIKIYQKPCTGLQTASQTSVPGVGSTASSRRSAGSHPGRTGSFFAWHCLRIPTWETCPPRFCGSPPCALSVSFFSSGSSTPWHSWSLTWKLLKNSPEVLLTLLSHWSLWMPPRLQPPPVENRGQEMFAVKGGRSEGRQACCPMISNQEDKFCTPA